MLAEANLLVFVSSSKCSLSHLCAYGRGLSAECPQVVRCQIISIKSEPRIHWLCALTDYISSGPASGCWQTIKRPRLELANLGYFVSKNHVICVFFFPRPDCRDLFICWHIWKGWSEKKLGSVCELSERIFVVQWPLLLGLECVRR